MIGGMALMNQIIEKKIRAYEIKSTVSFLCAMLFLALGLFGVIRGELAFIAFFAASATLLALCWFVSPAYQYKNLPANTGNQLIEAQRSRLGLERRCSR